MFSSVIPATFILMQIQSFTMSQTQPKLVSGGGGAGLQRRPTAKAPEGGPLLSLEKEKEVESSAFTGKGLLGV